MLFCSRHIVIEINLSRVLKFPSNWELSIARAVSVAKYFVDVGKINPQRLSAVGYDESRPLVPNDAAAGRA